MKPSDRPPGNTAYCLLSLTNPTTSSGHEQAQHTSPSPPLPRHKGARCPHVSCVLTQEQQHTGEAEHKETSEARGQQGVGAGRAPPGRGGEGLPTASRGFQLLPEHFKCHHMIILNDTETIR